MKRQGGGATAALEKLGIVLERKKDLRIDLMPKHELPFRDYTDGSTTLGLLFFVSLSWLRTCYVRDYTYYRFINEVNAGVHEIGHLVFSVVGSQQIYVLGGTFLQLLFPVLFFWFFWKREKQFIASLCITRFSINFFNIAVYMYDATRLKLPLMSMSGKIETTVHDRNYLFDLWGVIVYTDQIAFTVQLLGYFFYLLSLASLGYLLVKKRKMKESEVV